MKGLSKLKIKRRDGADPKDRSALGTIVKGALVALCVSLVGILVFAFLLKFLPISDGAVKPVNQIIKCISIFLGVFLATKKRKEQGLLTGLLIGLAYTVLAFIVFSALDGNFEFNKTLFNDILFGGIIGGISGIISVNIGKRK